MLRKKRRKSSLSVRFLESAFFKKPSLVYFVLKFVFELGLPEQGGADQLQPTHDAPINTHIFTVGIGVTGGDRFRRVLAKEGDLRFSEMKTGKRAGNSCFCFLKTGRKSR